MRQMIAPIFLSLAALTSAAHAETRALSGFDSVEASGRYRVQIVQAEQFSVSVTGADADKVQTRVHDGELQITQAGTNWFGGRRELRALVVVQMPNISELSASRGVAMEIGAIASNDIELNASQGAALTITALRAGAAELNASQGGALEASGTCQRFEANASMGGVIDAENFACTDGEANASMGGLVDIHATGAVEASASMGGMIDVRGNAQQRTASSSMGGEIDFH